MSEHELTFPQLPSQMDSDTFVNIFGGVYEHSPWVAQIAWAGGLTQQHDTPAGLSAAMQVVVSEAPAERLMELINLHPDLAGKAAVQGELTPESTAEQSGAGISECTAEEFEDFERLNNAYKEKFRFPFIMAVKGSNRHLILAAFKERLDNDADTEFRRAIAEINNIARFRLDAIAGGE